MNCGHVESNAFGPLAWTSESLHPWRLINSKNQWKIFGKNATFMHLIFWYSPDFEMI
jgi:hypothetical protein